MYYFNNLKIIIIFKGIWRLESFSTSTRSQIKFKFKLMIWLGVAFTVIAPSYLVTRHVVPIGLFSFYLQVYCLFHFHNILIKGILNKSEQLLYGLTNNYIGNNFYVIIGLFVLNIMRGFLLYIVLMVISIVVIFKFRNHLKQKQTVIRDQSNNTNQQKTTNQKIKEKSNNRVTKMVLLMSLNFIIGNMPLALGPILFGVTVNSTVLSYYGIVANLFAILSHFTYIIMFYKFNTKFKKVFLNTFCVPNESHQQIYFYKPRSANQPKTIQDTN